MFDPPGRLVPPHGPRAAPRPLNLPSLKKEHGGVDPHLQLVPKGQAVWGGKKVAGETAVAAAVRVTDEYMRAAARAEEARQAAEAARLAEEEAARTVEELAARAAAAKERAARVARESQERSVALCSSTVAPDCQSFEVLDEQPVVDAQPISSRALGDGGEQEKFTDGCGDVALGAGCAPVFDGPLGTEGLLQPRVTSAMGVDSVPQARTSEHTDAGPSHIAVEARNGNSPTLADLVELISLELELETELPMALVVAQANETMGIAGEGSIPEQVAALAREMGIITGGIEDWQSQGDHHISYHDTCGLLSLSEASSAYAARNHPGLAMCDGPILVSSTDGVPGHSVKLLMQHTPSSVGGKAADTSSFDGTVARHLEGVAASAGSNGVAVLKPDFSSMTIEEREAHYAAVRARIMGTSGTHGRIAGRGARIAGTAIAASGAGKSSWRRDEAEPKSAGVAPGSLSVGLGSRCDPTGSGHSDRKEVVRLKDKAKEGGARQSAYADAAPFGYECSTNGIECSRNVHACEQEGAVPRSTTGGGGTKGGGGTTGGERTVRGAAARSASGDGSAVKMAILQKPQKSNTCARSDESSAEHKAPADKNGSATRPSLNANHLSSSLAVESMCNSTAHPELEERQQSFKTAVDVRRSSKPKVRSNASAQTNATQHSGGKHRGQASKVVTAMEPERPASLGSQAGTDRRPKQQRGALARSGRSIYLAVRDPIDDTCSDSCSSASDTPACRSIVSASRRTAASSDDGSESGSSDLDARQAQKRGGTHEANRRGRAKAQMSTSCRQGDAGRGRGQTASYIPTASSSSGKESAQNGHTESCLFDLREVAVRIDEVKESERRKVLLALLHKLTSQASGELGGPPTATRHVKASGFNLDQLGGMLLALRDQLGTRHMLRKIHTVAQLRAALNQAGDAVLDASRFGTSPKSFGHVDSKSNGHNVKVACNINQSNCHSDGISAAVEVPGTDVVVKHQARGQRGGRRRCRNKSNSGCADGEGSHDKKDSDAESAPTQTHEAQPSKAYDGAAATVASCPLSRLQESSQPREEEKAVKAGGVERHVDSKLEVKVKEQRSHAAVGASRGNGAGSRKGIGRGRGVGRGRGRRSNEARR